MNQRYLRHKLQAQLKLFEALIKDIEKTVQQIEQTKTIHGGDR